MLPDSGNPPPQDETASADDPDAFDQYWAEAASSRSAPAEAAAEEPADDPAGQDGTDGAPEGETPPGTPAEAAAPAPAEQPDDVWKDVPERARKVHQDYVRDAEHRERSLRGRLSASDRTIQELRTAQVQPAPSGATKEQPRETAADDLLASDQFQQFQEEYGEVAGPIATVLKGLQDRVNHLSGSVGEVEQGRAVAIANANAETLTARHPDWLACAKDDRFTGWLETQPTSVKQAAQRNWNAIVDPEDAALVFDRFKAAFSIGPSPSPTPTPAPQPDPRRKRQLDGGRDARIKPVAAASGEPDDFDAAFENAARAADSRRRPQKTL